MKRAKLPRVFRGAAVVRGLGMDSDKLDKLLDRASLDQFDATQPMYLVIEDDALVDRDGSTQVRGFTDEATAIRVARALGNGNVNHRVVRVTAQTLVIATENDL